MNGLSRGKPVKNKKQDCKVRTQLYNAEATVINLHKRPNPTSLPSPNTLVAGVIILQRNFAVFFPWVVGMKRKWPLIIASCDGCLYWLRVCRCIEDTALAQQVWLALQSDLFFRRNDFSFCRVKIEYCPIKLNFKAALSSDR